MVPERWSIIIPAAGTGSRLQHSGPKILYPVAGRSILEWMLGSCAGLIQDAVLVVSPAAQEEILRALEKITVKPARVTLIEQPAPIGMADAVARGLEAVRTPGTWLVWGDQPFIRRQKIRELSAELERSRWAGILPLVEKKDPYVHYAIDARGCLTAVSQMRENEALPSVGLSDLGCFAFQVEDLRRLLATSPRNLSAVTREWNFLPELPRLDEGGAGLAFSRFETVDPEGISINTPAEGRAAEEWLRRYPDWNEDPHA